MSDKYAALRAWKPYHADGGHIGSGRIKEIADNVYGDEEKIWLARRVLSLLAEREADKARIAELDSQRRLAFTACNRWADKFREAEQRIAELESRKVKLPSLNPHMFNDDVMFGYRKAQKEAVEFCAAAGITLETGE